MLAIIGGSGLDALAGLKEVRRVPVATPYGVPSAPVQHALLNGHAVLFLPRHGEQHQFAPHLINYRANVWALRACKATRVLAVATVGGISADFGAGVLSVPDQIIDYTWGRESTYSDGASGGVRHIDFTQPFDTSVRDRALRAAVRAGVSLRDGGVYAATQGPRLESAAEIRRLARDGADIVGMTGMPEAALARELDLPYAMLALVVNAAAGTGASASAIDLAAAAQLARARMAQVLQILKEMAADGD